MLLLPNVAGLGAGKDIGRVLGRRAPTMDCGFMAGAGILVFIEWRLGDGQINYFRSDAPKN